MGRFLYGDGIRVYLRDPVDGHKILREDTREILFNWCEECCKGKYWIGMGFGMFELDEDVTMFKLTWGWYDTK